MCYGLCKIDEQCNVEDNDYFKISIQQEQMYSDITGGGKESYGYGSYSTDVFERVVVRYVQDGCTLE